MAPAAYAKLVRQFYVCDLLCVLGVLCGGELSVQMRKLSVRTRTALFVSVAVVAARTVLVGAPLTPEQTLDRRAIGELSFSPDGARLVFTVTDPPKGTARPRALWLLDVASGQLRQLTFSGKSDSGARWSPDGSAIAFVSDRGGTPQLYRLSMRGGEAEQRTDRKEEVREVR